jgi:hypothetical protein
VIESQGLGLPSAASRNTERPSRLNLSQNLSQNLSGLSGLSGSASGYLDASRAESSAGFPSYIIDNLG